MLYREDIQAFSKNLAFLTIITQVLSSTYPLMQHTYILTLCPEFSQCSASPWGSRNPTRGQVVANSSTRGGRQGRGAWRNYMVGCLLEHSVLDTWCGCAFCFFWFCNVHSSTFSVFLSQKVYVGTAERATRHAGSLTHLHLYPRSPLLSQGHHCPC